MIVWTFLLSLAIPLSEQPILRLKLNRPGAGRIESADAPIETPTLSLHHPHRPRRGQRWSFRVPRDGAYHLLLRAEFFDAYLVLRDEQGAILFEDDNGFLQSHALLNLPELEAGREYLADVCALIGLGAYELTLTEGLFDAPPQAEQRQQALEEAQLAHQRALALQDLPAGSRIHVLNRYGSALSNLAMHDQARSIMLQALEEAEASLGGDHPEVARIVNSLGTLLEERGEHLKALEKFERALAICEQLPGDDPETARALGGISQTTYGLGEYARARECAERALRISVERGQEQDLETATLLERAAVARFGLGEYDDAVTNLRTCLEIRERLLGADHIGVINTIGTLAACLHQSGHSVEAEQLFIQALDEIGDQRNLTVAALLTNLGVLRHSRADYQAAQSAYERALELQEDLLGHDNDQTATSYNNLAAVHSSLGDLEESIRLYRIALEIREQVLGPVHPLTALSLNNLALALQNNGEYEEALERTETALEIRELRLGPDHFAVAQSLNAIAIIHMLLGDFVPARRFYERALKIREDTFGPDHVETANSRTNLAKLLYRQGDFDAARLLLERALETLRSELGDRHPTTADSLGALAATLLALGELQPALDAALESLAAFEEHQGVDSAATSTPLNNVASILEARGNYLAARPYLERSLAIGMRTLPAGHPQIAITLRNLGNNLSRTGQPERAMELTRQALALFEQALGPGHPHTVGTRINLATQAYELRQFDLAWSEGARAVQDQEQHLTNLVPYLAEEERYLAVARFSVNLSFLLSILERAPKPERERQAYAALLRWKGRIFRSLLERPGSDRDDPVHRELSRVNAQLSGLVHQASEPVGNDSQRRLERLKQRQNELQRELAGASGSARPPDPFTPSRILERLPRDSALLDFFVHSRLVPPVVRDEKRVQETRWAEPELTAWVARSGAEEVQRISLGPAAPIERALRAYLQAALSVGSELRDVVPPRRKGVTTARTNAGQRAREVGQELTRLLWEPLAPLVQGARHVFIDPDQFLGALPFGVLPVADGSLLIEQFAFSDLQDLGTLEQQGPRQTIWGAHLSLGGVDYGSIQDEQDLETPVGPGLLSLRSALGARWPALSQTGPEARTVDRLHQQAFPAEERLLLTGAFCTEERLKAGLAGCSSAHLATHGFFEPEGLASIWRQAQAAVREPASAAPTPLNGVPPGLLAGLVTSGANLPPEHPAEDGLLTAEEVAALDLSQTELIVLSSCKSALGSTSSGEGMAGLRRAFHIAGARTVISSLWSVPDASTAELMEAFYRKLWIEGLPTGEALRQAQLELLEQDRDDVSRWGAFVLSGDWR